MTAPEMTDEEMDAIYGRSAFARWSEPMKGDDLRDMLSEAFSFVNALVLDPDFKASQRELYLMHVAFDVFRDLWKRDRPGKDRGDVPVPVGAYGDFGGL